MGRPFQVTAEGQPAGLSGGTVPAAGQRRRPSVTGTYSRTWKTKMYRVDGNYLRFSGVNNPAMQDPASTTNPGAGFINLSLNDPEGEYSAADGGLLRQDGGVRPPDHADLVARS
jgi:hypothetical protein